MRDHLRDYSTAAFRFFAHWGSKENYVNYLLDDLQRQKGSGPCSPTEAALVRKDQALREKAAEIADLEAVEMVLRICQLHYPDVYKSIEMVYLQKPSQELEWGDIQRGVHDAELTIPASESSVYRWLKRARVLFAEERGLRI